MALTSCIPTHVVRLFAQHSGFSGLVFLQLLTRFVRGLVAGFIHLLTRLDEFLLEEVLIFGTEALTFKCTLATIGQAENHRGQTASGGLSLWTLDARIAHSAKPDHVRRESLLRDELIHRRR